MYQLLFFYPVCYEWPDGITNFGCVQNRYQMLPIPCCLPIAPTLLPSHITYSNILSPAPYLLHIQTPLQGACCYISKKLSYVRYSGVAS